MMPIYVSTFSFGNQLISEALGKSLVHGILNVELGAGVSYSPDLLESVYEASDKGFKFLVHNHFPPSKETFVLNLASDNKETLGQSRQHCKKAIDLCSRLGCPFYSVHSGFAIELEAGHLGKPEIQAQLPKDLYIPHERAYKNFIDSLLEINEYAKAKGVGILIENNVITPRQVAGGQKDVFLMTSADEINSLMRQVDDENIGLLVDIGHLNVSAEARGFDREEFIQQLSPYIRAFHLSENDGQTDQNLPIDSYSWFMPFLKDFPESVFVIEAYGLSITQIKEQIQLVKGVD